MADAYREHVVCRRLRVTCLCLAGEAPQHFSSRLTGTERRPGRRTPPGDDEAEQPSKSRPAGLSGPQVNGTGGRRGGAYLCDDGSGDEGENQGDEVARPVDVRITFHFLDLPHVCRRAAHQYARLPPAAIPVL